MSGLLQKMMEGLTMDDAADAHFKQFLKRRQPPVLTDQQLRKGKNFDLDKVTLDHRIRMISKFACRMAVLDTEEQVALFHCGENSKVCGEAELGELRFGMEFLPAIEKLLKVYPKWTKIKDLDIDIEDKYVDENRILLAEQCLETGCFEISKVASTIKVANTIKK